MTTPRRLPAVAVAISLLAALAGCAGIPDSGSVQQGDPITSDVVDSDVVYTPNGPSVGSSQEQLLNGFLAAGTGPQNDYAVARQFLSTGFADGWNPRDSVMVRPGTGTTTRVSDTRLDYTFVDSATVDDTGRYTPATSSVPTTLGYRFVQEDGQWRISDAPDGIVLTPATFQSVFRSHAIYFYDPTFTYLVPDERWFLARSSTSTRIASAVLAGPSSWLQGAVVSAFPDGTRLSLTAITVDDGTARVDLTADALGADPTARARMQAQLLASFSSVAAITAVELSVESTALDVPELGQDSPLRDPTVDARPLVVADGVLGFASRSAVSELAGLSPTVTDLGATALELSGDQTRAAVATPEGAVLVRADGSSRLLDARPGLAPPSLDDRGYVWSVRESDPGDLLVIGGDGVVHAVSSSLPDGADVVTLRVSRDGSRVLALLDDDGDARLTVAAVVRDAEGVPTALGPALELATATGVPVDATWADQSSVAVLTRAGDEPQVTVSEVGGPATSRGRPPGDPESIVGGNGVGRLQVRTADGMVLEPRGSSWQDSGIRADLLATQR